MKVKELLEILEHEVQMERGDYQVIVWDTSREKVTDTLRDAMTHEFYICTGN